MLVGVPNVGKSALINSIHRIATSRFPGIIISEEIKSFLIVCDPCLYCCISSER
jgi:GTP-binding protein EngB required for normal cell division